MKRINGFYLSLIMFLLSSSINVFAHSGGTDSSGCHTNHSNGTYHCHNPKGFRNNENVLRAPASVINVPNNNGMIKDKKNHNIKLKK